VADLTDLDVLAMTSFLRRFHAGPQARQLATGPSRSQVDRHEGCITRTVACDRSVGPERHARLCLWPQNDQVGAVIGHDRGALLGIPDDGSARGYPVLSASPTTAKQARGQAACLCIAALGVNARSWPLSERPDRCWRLWARLWQWPVVCRWLHNALLGAAVRRARSGAQANARLEPCRRTGQITGARFRSRAESDLL